MNTVKLSNIPLDLFRKFLFEKGCEREEKGTKGRGGHEKWNRKDLSRPITLQTHIDPVCKKRSISTHPKRGYPFTFLTSSS